MQRTLDKIFIFISFLVLLSIYTVISFDSFKHPSLASSSDNLSGYAWSDNIGWISFNCTNDSSCGTSNYGVTVNGTSGDLSGYAWSDNVGWVSFNPSDVVGCPSSPCTPNISRVTGNASGWFRVLSGVGGSGWDGWVSLSGVTATGMVISGYAWGSDVVGWVDMSAVVSSINLKNIPTGTISASPTSVNGGATSLISWTATDASACTVISTDPINNDSWTGLSNIGVSTTPLYASGAYQLVCDGSLVSSVAITVTTIPELTASAIAVNENDTVTLTWNTHNGDESLCTWNGNAISLNGDLNIGSTPVTVTAKTTYTLSCPGGSDSVTVEILARGFES